MHYARLIPTALVAVCALAALSAAPPVPKAKPAPSYFPHAVGTKWVYATTGRKDRMTKEVVKVAAEKDGETRVTIRATNGDSTAGSDADYGVTADAVFLRVANDRKIKGHDELWLKLPLKEDAEWEWETKGSGVTPLTGTGEVGRAEKVKVAAGEFECLPVVITVQKEKGKEVSRKPYTRWYAAGVGLVKAVSEDVTVELVEFTPGKGK